MNWILQLSRTGAQTWRDAEVVLEDGKFIVSREVEKMSKSKYNVVNPDNICEEYGADSLRLYEMFLGPWNNLNLGIQQGYLVFTTLKKLWKLYLPFSEGTAKEAAPTKENLKTLHKTIIKKVEEDVKNFSFNTSVSTFMICVNELTAQKCRSKEIF